MKWIDDIEEQYAEDPEPQFLHLDTARLIAALRIAIEALKEIDKQDCSRGHGFISGKALKDIEVTPAILKELY